MGKVAACLKMTEKHRKLLLVGFVKPTDSRTVDIQNADHVSFKVHRNHDFGI